MIVEKILEWAEDRNLIKGSTPQAQFLKLVEELGEVREAMERANLFQIKDGIGDSYVVLIIMLAQMGYGVRDVPQNKHNNPIMASIGNLSRNITKNRHDLAIIDIGELIFSLKHFATYHFLTLDECLESAYNEIKDRKGKMVDGVFIKEEN